jgi:hypothetical protein
MRAVACLIGAGLLLAAQSPALAQQGCGDAVSALAQRHNIALAPADSGEPTAPSAPATKESLGVGVMDRLEQAGSVNRPENAEGSSGSSAAAPADSTDQANARRIQAEALLNEARQDAQGGRMDDCRTKFDAARPLLEASGQ